MMGYCQLVLMTWLVTLVTSHSDSCNGRASNGFTLNLTASSLTDLPTNMNENTTKLVACHNKLSVLANTTFTSTGKLQVIIIRFNEIRKLETGTFGSLSKLQEVDLGYNRIEYVDGSLFKYNRLYKLNLEHNSISYFSPNILKYANDFWKLKIGHNKITELHPHTFLNTSLIEIDVSRNVLSKLDHKIFQKNRRISKLDVSSNMISELHRDILKPAYVLKRLNISYNNIALLEVSLLNNNTNLEILDLSNNAIEHIFPETFKNNCRLEILNMSKNKLTSLNKDIFLYNVGIKAIDISRNNIAYIHPETFKMNRELSVLNMKENRLGTLKEQIFLNNVKLEIVDLSSNKIEAIDPDTFVRNTEIRRLNLSANIITKLIPHTFDTNKNLIDVDVSYNMITEIDRKLFSVIPIKNLSLRGNKLSIKSQDLPLLAAHSLEELDLRSCGITMLPPKTFQGVLNLTELILDQNNLQLPVEADPEDNIFRNLYQLSKLDLSRNNITTISASLLRDMNNLKLLNLSFNPIKCYGGVTEDFWNWCSTRSVQCVLTCNSDEESPGTATAVNGMNTIPADKSMPYRGADVSMGNNHSRNANVQLFKKEKVGESNIKVKVQDVSVAAYLSVGVCSALIVIAVVLAIMIINRRRK